MKEEGSVFIKLPIPPPEKTALKLIRGERRWGDLKTAEKLPVLQKIHQAGSLPALHLALQVMKEDAAEKSKWVIEGTLQIVADRVEKGFTIGLGSSGNELQKHRAAMKHLNRWRIVKKLREKRGVTLEKAYARAGQHLTRKQGKAKPETIRNSYRRVQKDMKSIDTAAQYFAGLPDIWALVKIDKVYLADEFSLGNE